MTNQTLGARGSISRCLKHLLRHSVVIFVLFLCHPALSSAQSTCGKKPAFGCPCADSRNPFTLVRELEKRLVCIQHASRRSPSDTQRRSAGTTPPSAEELQAAEEATAKRLAEARDLVSFVKGNFGLGLFAGHGIGGTRIDSARLENDRVVVNQELTNRGAVVFEYHRFPWRFRDGSVGFGPFAMVSSIPDDLTKLDSFGTGLMFGFRDLLQGSGFLNVGLGVSLDRDITQLAPGFVAGELAPLDAEGTPIEPGVLTKSKFSLFFLISFTPRIPAS